MFTGLSAFPLTPMSEQGLHEDQFTRLIESLASAGVDSIGALGSTGSYAYLTRAERARIRTCRTASGGLPAFPGPLVSSGCHRQLADIHPLCLHQLGQPVGGEAHGVIQGAGGGQHLLMGAQRDVAVDR